MKAITIKQPFASLIAAGIKEYEFRTWKTNYRGDILIHAGKGIDKKAMKKFEEYGLEYPSGVIIAKARLVDCIKVDEEFRKVLSQKNPKVYSSIIKNTEWGGYAFQLEDVEILEPSPVMGKLSIWEVDYVLRNKKESSIDFSTITACGECCVGCGKKETGICQGCIESDGYCAEWAQSKGCPIHKCTREHGVQFCGLCKEFPCEWLINKVVWRLNVVEELADLARDLLECYKINPCGTLSIPYWKQKSITIPPNMKIVHEKDYKQEAFEEYKDEPYFRLIHELKETFDVKSEIYTIETVTEDDIPSLVEVINQSYTDLSVTHEQLIGYTKTIVYDRELWVLVIDKRDFRVVGCGIADLDRDLKEGILEWIQVLPAYRGEKIGQLIVNELLKRMKGKAEFVTVSGKTGNVTNPEILYRKCGFVGDDIWHILTK